MDEDELENWFQSTTTSKPKAATPQPAVQRPSTSEPASSRQSLTIPGGSTTSTNSRSTPTKGKFDLFADDLFDDVTNTNAVVSIPVPTSTRPSSTQEATARPSTSTGYNVLNANTSTTSNTSRPKTAGGSSLKKFDLNEDDDDIASILGDKSMMSKQRPATAASTMPRPKSTTFDFPVDDSGQSPAKPKTQRSTDMFDEMFSTAAGTSPVAARKQPQIKARETSQRASSFKDDESANDTDNDDAPEPKQRKAENKSDRGRKKSPLDALFGDEEDSAGVTANRPASRQRTSSNKKETSNARKLNLSELGLGRGSKTSDGDEQDTEDAANLHHDPKTKITGSPKAIEDLRQQVELTQTQIKEREKVIVGAKADFESQLRDELGKSRVRQQEVMDKQRNALLEFTLVEQKAASEEELKRLNELQVEMQRLHDFQLQLLKFGGSVMNSGSPYAALVANPVLTGMHPPTANESLPTRTSSRNLKAMRSRLHHHQSPENAVDEENELTDGEVAALTDAIVSQVTNVIPKLHNDVENVYKARMSALETELKSRDDRISTLQAKLDGLEEKTVEAKESSHKFVHQVMEEHAMELQHMKQLHERRLEELRTDYSTHLERIKQVYREQVESVETFVNMERAQRLQMREQMSNENKALFELKDKLLGEKEQAVEEARAELARRQEQVNEVMATLRDLREQLLDERRRANEAVAKADERADQRRADYQALLSECEKERNGITTERVELLAERARWTDMFKSELALLNTARQELTQEKEHFKQLLVEERKRMAEERELQSEYSLAALQSNLDLSKQRAELEGMKNITSQRMGTVEQERRQLLALQKQLQRVKQAAQQNYHQTEHAKNEQTGQLGHARHLVQMAERLIQKASTTAADVDENGNLQEDLYADGRDDGAADGGDNFFVNQQQNGSRRPSPHTMQQRQENSRLSADSQALYDNMQNSFKMLSVRHQQLAQQRFLLHNKWQRLLKDGQGATAMAVGAVMDGGTDTNGSLTSMSVLQAQRNDYGNSAAAFMSATSQDRVHTLFPLSSGAAKTNPAAFHSKTGSNGLKASFSAVYTYEDFKPGQQTMPSQANGYALPFLSTDQRHSATFDKKNVSFGSKTGASANQNHGGGAPIIISDDDDDDIGANVNAKPPDAKHEFSPERSEYPKIQF